ncbi:MAG: ABC transporter substrate-binding protein, partial [bacterium]
AIDREELNESVYFGRAKPRQYTVLKSSKYYKPEFEKAYIEYNPDKTKDLLDEIGLEDQDGDGWRELPNGKDFNFTIEYVDRVTPKAPNVELVIEYWKDVGIDVNAKQISAELQRQRAPANMMDCTIWNGDKATDILFPRAAQFFVPQPPGWERTIWPKWGRWLTTDGDSGEEPPAQIKELYNIWEEMIEEPDADRRIELGKEIAQMQADNLWVIGTIGEAPQPLIINKNLGNVPEDGLFVWDTLYTMRYDPEQFYFKQ